nr:helix-turn-helix domain-containing protein [Streptomyces sp. CBMA156]
MHELLLRTAGAPGADFRVLAFYATAVPLGQTVRTVGKAIAESLRLSEPTVSKSIKRLAAEGWLELVYRQGPINFYRVGPLVMEAAAELLVEGEEQDEDDLATIHHLPFGQHGGE